MYKKNKMAKSQMKSVEILEGEPIEHKIERLVSNGEPIKDGAPEIFTERKDGVIKAYNIRTDRWEVAADAMDAVHRSKDAKRDSIPNTNKKDNKTDESGKVVDMKPNKDDGVEPIQGTK